MYITATNRIPVKSSDVSNLYSEHLALDWYSVQDMVEVLTRRTDELASTIDCQTLWGQAELYLLNVRKNSLVEMLKNPNSELHKAIIGFAGVAPYIVEQIVCSDCLNIFLARDAGQCFVASQQMNELGIFSNKSCIYYFSREKAKGIYELYKERVTSYRRDGLALVNLLGCLYADFLREIQANVIFRDRSIQFYDELKSLNLSEYRHIRFIDSWCDGHLLFYLVNLVRFFDEYNFLWSQVIPKHSAFHRKIDCFTADNRTLVAPANMVNYSKLAESFNSWWEYSPDILRIPAGQLRFGARAKAVNWRSSSLDLTTIKKWYSKRRISPPPLREEKLLEFCMIMAAQLYKPQQPYGSLDFGHPIDYSRVEHQLYVASSPKRLGALTRQLLIRNAIADYVDGGTADTESKEITMRHYFTEATDQLATDSVALDRELLGICADLHLARTLTDRMRKLRGYELTTQELKLFDRICHFHSEHFIHAIDERVITMLLNLQHTIRFVGPRIVRSLFRRRNYEAQYVLFRMSGIEPQDYIRRLATISNLDESNAIQQIVSRCFPEYEPQIYSDAWLEVST